ncbi:hypothetical protein J4G37_21295 [Microvirga sp. 3-52]|nr:hypothetical protein [Microvirga sp. 3-52]
MEEPGCLFAHGFFRRTGEAGSVDRRRRGRLRDGGLRPIPTTRPGILGLLSCGLARPAHRTGPAPTLRRLERAPRQEPI